MKEALLKSDGRENQISINESDSFLQLCPEWKPYKIPPDIDLARLHSKAKKVGRIVDFERSCVCCKLPVRKEEFALSCDIDDFAHIGQGIPLFFYYLKVIVISLVILLVPSQINLFQINIGCRDESRPPPQDCVQYLGIYYSIELSTHQRAYQLVISLVALVLLIVFMLGSKVFFKLKVQQYEHEHANLSSYTLLFKGFKQSPTPEELKNFLNEELQLDPQRDETVEIMHVCYCYKIRDYIRNSRKKNRLLSMRRDLESKMSLRADRDYQDIYRRKISDLDQRIYNLKAMKQLSNLQLFNQVDLIKIEKLFVTFGNIQDKRRVLKAFRATTCSNAIYGSCARSHYHTPRLYKGNLVTAKQAPHPLDIIWENLEEATNTKLLTRFKSIFLAAFYLGVTFCILSM